MVNYAPDFVVSCTEIGAVQWPQIWKFIGLTS